jgi:hypothetical protein
MTARSDPDLRVAVLADRRYGVVRYRQLLDAGLNRQTIAYRVKRRRLIELYPGVYALGHAQLRIEGKWLAAVYASGDRAALSLGDGSRI